MRDETPSGATTGGLQTGHRSGHAAGLTWVKPEWRCRPSIDRHMSSRNLVAEPHLQPADEVARRLGVDPTQGLAAKEVAERRAAHGPNRLPQPPERSLLWRVVDQFRDFMILVLLGAALLSGLLGDVVDTAAVLVIVVLNAAVGLAQEWRADRAMQALKQLAAPHATVRRAGFDETVDSEHLVPGDVVPVSYTHLTLPTKA